MKSTSVAKPRQLDEPLLNPAMEELLSGSRGIEYALAFMVNGMETLHRYSPTPAQKRMTKDYAMMGRECLRRKGTGAMEMLDQEVAKQEAADKA